MDLRTALPPTDGITSAASVTATALDPLLGMRAVAEQVGGISRMSLHRWAKDPKLQFPPADVVIYIVGATGTPRPSGAGKPSASRSQQLAEEELEARRRRQGGAS